jgi:hypothetical protein
VDAANPRASTIRRAVCSGEAEPNAVSNAIGYAKFYSRSHDSVIRVLDESGKVIETHEQPGGSKEP